MERIQAAIEKARAIREGKLPADTPVSPELSGPAPVADPAPARPADPAADRPAEKPGGARLVLAKDGEAAPAAPPRRAGPPQPPRFHVAKAPPAPAADEAGAAPATPAEGPAEGLAQTLTPTQVTPAQTLTPAPAPRPVSPAKLKGSAAAWAALKPFEPSARKMRRNRIVSFDRSDVTHTAYDMMRTRLLQFVRSKGWWRVAITSPTPDCGKSTTALNLAFSLAAQKDIRTVLMDVDLRRPSLAKMLGQTGPQSMVRFLDGPGDINENFLRIGETLAIGTNDHPARYPAELLQQTSAGEAIAKIRDTLIPDVLLYDMPPMMKNDDVMAFLSQVDCVLLVAAAETTTTAELDRCERELGSQTNVLGVVLNKCRYADDKYGYY